MASAPQHVAAHPAAEIVAITLRKLLKLANRKHHATLMAEAQGLLDSLPQLLPPEGHAAGSARSDARLQAALSESITPVEGSSSAMPDLSPHTPALDSEPSSAPAFPGDALQPEGAEGIVAPTLPAAALEDKGGAVKIEAAPAPAAADTAPVPVLAPLPDLITRTETALPTAVCDKIIAVMRLATATVRPNIMEPAVDCVQKLIAFRFLQGSVYAVNVGGSEDQGRSEPGTLKWEYSTQFYPESVF